MDGSPKIMISLGIALTIVHGVAPYQSVSRGEVVEVMRFMIQRPLRTIAGINEAVSLCRRVLLDQHPWLEEVIVPIHRIAEGDWLYMWAWQDAKERRYGQALVVQVVNSHELSVKNLPGLT